MANKTLLTASIVALATVLLASAAMALDHFGYIFDVQGDAELTSERGIAKPLFRTKDLLAPVDRGQRIRVRGKGKVLVVASQTNVGYEIGENAEGLVGSEEITAIAGGVTRRAGLSAPKRGTGQIGGVLLRSEKKTDCLRAVSPVNTAILDTTPLLRWENLCGGTGKVTLTVVSEDRVILTAQSGESSLRVPEGILHPGKRYMWIVDGGSQRAMTGGVFATLTERDAGEAANRLGSAPLERDVAGRISLVFYLLEMNLTELAQAEAERLRLDYPESAGIRELFH